MSKYFGFDDDLFKDDSGNHAHWIGWGDHYIFRFENGFGASVARHRYTYGGNEGLFELAIIKFEGDEWELTYDTKITDDVIGWCDEDEIAHLLGEIKALDSNYCDKEKENYDE